MFTNDKERSFFRNKGFWYLGNLGVWPPDTYFRCVDGDGCTIGEEFPPIVGYFVNKKYDSLSVPKISATKCVDDEL